MGGKSSTSQQQVGIPPSVLAQYNSVNSLANTTASTPFQEYSGQFVAPVNSTQQTGIAGTQGYANSAQPDYATATSGLKSTQAATAPTNAQALSQTAGSSSPLTASQIDSYLSPYLGTVLNSTEQIQNQENQQQQAGQLGTAISSGAFGGDRTGIAAANLAQQEDLANSNVISGIANTGYQSALGTAQGQQQIGLAGAAQEAQIGQTAYGEGANTASELAGLGSGAQTAGLQGASAELGAGTLQQQTQQAQNTALYNQFEQQQSYPFQVDQFLANIAEGTGALSGSTTTTTQPGGFFSDEKLKDNKRVIGKTFDGQPIYAYEMKGDPRTRIGLLAQQVERKHPEAVGVSQGFKTVDYGKATARAANEGHFHSGGVVPMRPRRAAGGPSIVDPGDLQAILAAQQQMYAPFSAGGPYGSAGGPHGGVARVPTASVPVSHLVTASSSGLRQQPTGAQNLTSAATLYKQGNEIYKDPKAYWNQPTQPPGQYQAPSVNATMPAAAATGYFDPSNQTADPNTVSGLQSTTQPPPTADNWASSGDTEDAARGGLIRRSGHADGGMPYSDPNGTLDIPDEDSHNTLSKPAALPPAAPSGFQQLMSMGQGMGGSGGIGNMLSGLGKSSSSSASSADNVSDVDSLSDADLGYDTGGTVKREPRHDWARNFLQTYSRAHRDFGGGADADSDDPSGNLGDSPDASVSQAVGLKQGAPNTSLDSVKNLALAAGEAYLGDYAGAADSVYNAYTDTQANNHKRGGRAGFDAGGTPDADLDMMPEQTVTADAIAPDTSYSGGVGISPVAAATPDAPASVPVDSPPADNSGGVAPSKSLWDKIKDSPLAESKNLVPLLTAIGAMGTAPTRHFGVALAAGLGAGAQSYVPTQEGLASAALTQQEAKGADIQNQRAQFQLGMLKNPPPSGTESSAPPPQRPLLDGIGTDPSDIASNAQDRFAISDIWLPGEQAQLTYNQRLQQNGMPNSLPSILAQHTARIQSLTTTNQLRASNGYDQAYTVASAPPGKAVVAMQRVAPQEAGRISQIATSQDDADALARAWASQTGNAVYRYAGREPVTGPDGIARDKLNQRPVLGQTPVGMSAEQNASFLERLATPVDTGAAARPALGSTAEGAAIPRNPQPSVVVPGSGSATPAVPARTVAPGKPTVPTAPIPYAIDGAPIESQYRLPKQPGVNDPQTPETQKTWDTTIAKRAELLDDAKSMTNSSAQGLAYVQAAQALMKTDGVPTGLSAPAKVAMSRIAEATGLTPGESATKNQELAKYLANLAVQSFKNNFGARPAAKEFDIQMQDLNPSDKMTPTAINGLLDFNSKNLGYLMQTGHRAAAYNAQNGDPQQFYDWNNTHFPQSAAVNAQPVRPGQTASGPAPVGSKADYDKLPSGTPYTFNGRHGVKP